MIILQISCDYICYFEILRANKKQWILWIRCKWHEICGIIYVSSNESIYAMLPLVQDTLLLVLAEGLAGGLFLWIYRKSMVFHTVLAMLLIAVPVFFCGDALARYGLVSFLYTIPAAVVLAIVALRNVHRQVKRPLQASSAHMQQIAHGDLSQRIPHELTGRRDEFASFAQALEQMVLGVSTLVHDSQQTAGRMATSSEQFKNQSVLISKGANDQAASAEEISAAMEELAANISQNLDNARQGAVISTQVDKDLNEVSTAFTNTAHSMQEIEGKIGTVSAIAHKTNILAINAAIEAARAGELGRGFAVVAAEVRRLADLSQKSALEIEQLSKESSHAVDTMGKTLETTIPNIKKITEVVQEIASSSAEQQTGGEQVNSALSQLVQVTNENSSTSEELSAEAESLEEIALQLKDNVGRFTVSSDLTGRA